MTKSMDVLTESVEIFITLSSDYWEKRFPGARVFVNDNLVFEDLIKEQQTIHWAGNLVDGKNKIIVEMYNKKYGDTVANADHKIIKDVLLNIDSIKIDDIDLGTLIWSQSKYYPKEKDAPFLLEQCVNLGWNGNWELEFESPTYIWILENM